MCPQLFGEIREVLTTRPRLRKWISLVDATLFVDTIQALVDLTSAVPTVLVFDRRRWCCSEALCEVAALSEQIGAIAA